MHSKQPSGKSAPTKKQIVTGPSSRRVNPYILAITIVLFVVAAGTVYRVWTAPQSTPMIAQTSPVNLPDVGNETVSYPLALFDNGKAQHFEYAFDGLTIRYFLLRSSDGVVRAAFDACDVCWRAGKGYFQEGDQMVCKNCNRRFASDRINEVQGGCNPAPLERTIQGEQVVIRAADIVQGHTYFNFNGRT
jgi:uncharacterized membrane protein